MDTEHKIIKKEIWLRLEDYFGKGDPKIVDWASTDNKELGDYPVDIMVESKEGAAKVLNFITDAIKKGTL